MALKGNAKPQGALCFIHMRGRGPGQGVPFVASCRVCVANRGHLPPAERDIPPSSAFKDRKATHGLFAYGPRKRRTA
jgi:hypothetical protein